MPYRSIIANVLSVTGWAAWVFIDTLLGTIAAVVAIAAGLMGLYWGYHKHIERKKIHKLDLELKQLEIEEKRKGLEG